MAVFRCCSLVMIRCVDMDAQLNFSRWTFHFAPAKNPSVEWLKFTPLTREAHREILSSMHAFMFLRHPRIHFQIALFASALRNRFLPPCPGLPPSESGTKNGFSDVLNPWFSWSRE